MAARSLKPLELLQRLLHFAFAAHDADQFLHHVLQLVLDLVRAFGAAAWLRRAQTGRAPRLAASSICASLTVHGRIFLRELRGVFAGAFAEDEQIGERIAAETVRAVQTGRAFARGEETGHARHLGVAVDAHAAHGVVRGRADFHRFLGDVEIARAA